MHQDFELSVALSEHEASVAATARKNETAVKALERSSAASAALSNGTYAPSTDNTALYFVYL